MEITDEIRERVHIFLNKVPNLDCKSCGATYNEAIEIQNIFFQLYEFRPTNPKKPGAIPLLALSCEKCFHVELYNAINILGLTPGEHYE